MPQRRKFWRKNSSENLAGIYFGESGEKLAGIKLIEPIRTKSSKNSSRQNFFLLKQQHKKLLIIEKYRENKSGADMNI